MLIRKYVWRVGSMLLILILMVDGWMDVHYDSWMVVNGELGGFRNSIANAIQRVTFLFPILVQTSLVPQPTCFWLLKSDGPCQVQTPFCKWSQLDEFEVFPNENYSLLLSPITTARMKPQWKSNTSGISHPLSKDWEDWCRLYWVVLMLSPLPYVCAGVHSKKYRCQLFPRDASCFLDAAHWLKV